MREKNRDAKLRTKSCPESWKGRERDSYMDRCGLVWGNRCRPSTKERIRVPILVASWWRWWQINGRTWMTWHRWWLMRVCGGGDFDSHFVRDVWPPPRPKLGEQKETKDSLQRKHKQRQTSKPMCLMYFPHSVRITHFFFFFVVKFSFDLC